MNAMMNPFMENIHSLVDEAIYKETLKLYARDKCEEYDEVLDFVSTKACGKESVISYTATDKKEVTIHTDKPENYWVGMEGKRVHIRGTKVYLDKEVRLIVLSAITCITIQGTTHKFTDEEIRKYDAMLSTLNKEQKCSVYALLGKIANIPDVANESDSYIQKMVTVEELSILYKVVKKVIPLDVRCEIERCFEDTKRGSNTDKQTAKKALFYLINNDWVGNNKSIDVALVQKRLDESHIGMAYPKKKLLKEAYAVNRSVDKKPDVILLVGSEGCGKTSLLESFFDAADIRFATYNLSGIDDPKVLTGSGRIYENGRPSNLFLKIFEVGKNGAIILDEIDKVGEECVSALLSFIDRNFLDEFLEVPIDISSHWIVCTANDIKKIPPALLSRMTTINVDDYSEDEKDRIINKVLVPRMCKKYQVEHREYSFPDPVCRKIICEYAAGKSIRAIEKIVREIFVSAFYKGEDFPEVTVENINQYFNWGEDTEIIRNSYAKELSTIERKFRTCILDYPEDVKKRNEVLLEMAQRGTDDEKMYALSALRITGNILQEDVKKADADYLKRKLDESHYGLEKVKVAVQKVMMANTLSGKAKIQAILLDGCPGVGKTSICKTIADALDRKFVKISLNGVSSSEEIKGFSRTYKDSQAGIIARKLAERDVCSYTALVLLDEVDKMIVKDKDDPYTTLHDLLDNNGGFYEQYLETTIPTDNILWILTSNDKSKVPQTILDRVTVIDVGGYSAKEKFVITKNYVIPKVAERYHLKSINVNNEVLRCLIEDYCISYGIRDVEEAIENLVETIVLHNGITESVTITKKDLPLALGAKCIGFNDFPDDSKAIYGQARALAVAGNYGSTFAIQIVDNPYGEEPIELTGLAKGSFAESVKVAKTLVCTKLKRAMPKVHIHALDAGIEKDGPSAGMTIFTAMMSFMLKVPLPNVAFTGTVDLFGNIGVIGGEKLKLAAAERAGVEKVYIPKENYVRLIENNELSAFSIKVQPVTHVDELIQELFGDLHMGDCECFYSTR